MNIRKAQMHDQQALVQFNQAMALETENKHLDEDILSRGVAGLLSHEERGFYLVATDDAENIIGSLMVTFEWSDWRNGTFWWIQSVYITPENRRKGVYSALYHRVQKMAQHEENVCGYRLYVENDNIAAQQTYKKLGMAPSHYLMFETEKAS